MLDQYRSAIDKGIDFFHELAKASGKEWLADTADAVRRIFDGLFGPSRLAMLAGDPEDNVRAALYSAAASEAIAVPAWLVPLLEPLALALLRRLLGR